MYILCRFCISLIIIVFCNVHVFVEVLELHVQQTDGLKQEDGYVNDEDYVNDGGQDDNDGIVKNN